MTDPSTDRDLSLPDLTQVELRTFFSSADTALGHAVRRVLRQLEQSDEVLSAHSSYAE